MKILKIGQTMKIQNMK